MKLTVVNKIGLIMASMALLIIVSGLAGLNGVKTLENSLTFITTQAWDAADGAMEGTIELQAEIIASERVLNHAISEEEGRRLMDEAQAGAQEALTRMTETGLIAQNRIEELNQKLDSFRTSRQVMLETFNTLQKFTTEADTHLDQIDLILSRLEETIETRLDNQALASMAPQDIQVIWDAADATMETRIGLLTGSHAIGQMHKGIAVEKQPERIEKSLKQAADQLRILSNSPILAEIETDQTLSTTLNASFERQKALFTAIIETIQQFQVQKKRQDENASALLSFLEELEEAGDSKVEGEMDNISQAESSAFSSVVITILLGLIIATLAYFASLKTIARPIKNVASLLQQIAQQGGDLTQQIDFRGKDEIADLAAGFNQFIARTRDIIQRVKNSSDLAAKETLVLQNDIEQTQQASQEQKAETEQVASAVTELVATVSNVTLRAGEAADASEQANASTTHGRELVQKTLQQVQQLAVEMEQAAQAINQVQSEADHIGGVLDVIRGIAEQTNLLALNAAIEAARAGDQGRGFAVVADEVRTLASRTQDSTTEIQAMIDTLQQGTRNAVEVIQRSHEKSNESAETALKTGESFNVIVDAMSTINEINQQIANATREQEVATKLIGSNAENINAIAESTAEKASRARASTMELLLHSKQMSELVSQFKT